MLLLADPQFQIRFYATTEPHVRSALADPRNRLLKEMPTPAANGRLSRRGEPLAATNGQAAGDAMIGHDDGAVAWGVDTVPVL